MGFDDRCFGQPSGLARAGSWFRSDRELGWNHSIRVAWGWVDFGCFLQNDLRVGGDLEEGAHRTHKHVHVGSKPLEDPAGRSPSGSENVPPYTSGPIFKLYPRSVLSVGLVGFTPSGAVGQGAVQMEMYTQSKVTCLWTQK